MYHNLHALYVGLARTIYIRFAYGILYREITIYTIIYGVYIRFWPTLPICQRIQINMSTEMLVVQVLSASGAYYWEPANTLLNQALTLLVLIKEEEPLVLHRKEELEGSWRKHVCYTIFCALRLHAIMDALPQTNRQISTPTCVHGVASLTPFKHKQLDIVCYTGTAALQLACMMVPQWHRLLHQQLVERGTAQQHSNLHAWWCHKDIVCYTSSLLSVAQHSRATS